MPNLREIFTGQRYAATLSRVVKFLSDTDEKYSDRSFERVTRPGVITEAVFLEMPTVSAYAAEIELMIAIVAHAEGKVSDESIKVYLAKYIETHTFRYEPNGQLIRQVLKSGHKTRTGRDVPLFYLHRGVADLDDAHVCNGIQACFRQEIAKFRGHASYSVSRL